MTTRHALLATLLCVSFSSTSCTNLVTSAILLHPEPGIDREMARIRAESIRDVRYELHFVMAKGMQAVQGTIVATFDLEANLPAVLDFAGEDLRDVQVNGVEAVVRQVHNHLVIPADQTVAGRNEFRAAFTSKVAPTGTPLTVYKDKTDGAEYYYTLVVPADAHRLFPCFDQPDIKARYAVTVTAPAQWKVIANSPHRQSAESPAVSVHEFAETTPLSTYVFAFAAGPFAEVMGPEMTTGAAKGRPMRLYARKSKLDKLEKDLLFKMHGDAARWLSDYFRYPYPFGKLDFVLVPGFPYGGMEHAGAIFYRETALLFDQKPTEGELTRRSTLVYHEVSHQWFGNLVTMRWFDDLWLKEGFATFMGYTLFETLEPGKHAWLRFHHRVKPRAYRVDATTGTTPVYQKLKNLADAKSAYGAIVYNKAPAILRELNHRLGPATFQKGLQQFLKNHEYANATWQDLVAALEDAAQQNAAPWSNRWILAAGMPKVEAVWDADAGQVRTFEVRQQSVQGGTDTWPLQLEVLLIDDAGAHERVKVVADQASTPIAQLLGRPRPACVLLNPGDVAYGQFLLDAVSRAWLVANVQTIRNPLVRAVAMSALWETVREAQLDPVEFAGAAMRLLGDEKDAGTHAWLLGSLRTALLRYTTPERSGPLLDRLCELLLAQLAAGHDAIKTQTLRVLMSTCRGAKVVDLCAEVAGGKSPAPGLQIGKRDRFFAAAALLAAGRGRGPLDALVADLGKQDIARQQDVAGAADPEAKKVYFESYLNLDEPPEQWVSISLGNFHWPGQESLTLGYLRPALERVEWVKKNRKIFFMPAWIDAFVNGHSSREALAIVNSYLSEYPDLPIDIRRKILQSHDSLRRAVEIRTRWN